MPDHPSCRHVAYRLSCADYDAMLERAQGRCEICKIPAEQTPRGSLCIDHDPRYGGRVWAVRGLVCDKCNSLLRFTDRYQKFDRRVYAYYRSAWFATRPRMPAELADAS